MVPEFDLQSQFSNFSCMFLNPNNFFQSFEFIRYEKPPRAFEILGLQPLEQFFLTVGQNNFGNKIL